MGYPDAVPQRDGKRDEPQSGPLPDSTRSTCCLNRIPPAVHAAHSRPWARPTRGIIGFTDKIRELYAECRCESQSLYRR